MLRCPYCHDSLSAARNVACGRCSARHHLDCFVENGGCAVMGCHRTTVRASRREPPPERASSSWTTGAIKLAVALAILMLPPQILPWLTRSRSAPEPEPVPAEPASSVASVASIVSAAAPIPSGAWTDEHAVFDLLLRATRGEESFTQLEGRTIGDYELSTVHEKSTIIWHFSAEPRGPVGGGAVRFDCEGSVIHCYVDPPLPQTAGEGERARRGPTRR